MLLLVLLLLILTPTIPQWCGAPYKNAPVVHLMDQHGCGENDPNGPVFGELRAAAHWHRHRRRRPPPPAAASPRR